ncbi:MAG: succinate dehydrogenase [Rhodospirillales bacterium]
MTPERAETLEWLVQRVSAMVLALCVIVHLAVIVIAVQGGVTSKEIVARVGGSVPWLLFYSTFVVAVALHAPAGLRNILREYTGLGKRATHWIMAGVCVLILVMGFRAVIGLYGLGA